MMGFWAALPIAVALGLLILRAGPAWAAAAALVSGLWVAFEVFAAAPGPIVSAQIAMGPLFVEVAAIMLGGLWLNRLLTLSGVQQRLGLWLADVCRDPARAVLLVVLGVVPFAESVTGFGIGAVVGVPLLIHFGFSRARAATLGLLGLVIVPWGSLAPGTLVAARIAGVDFQALGAASALLLGPVFVLMGACGLVLALGPRRALAAWIELLASAAALWGGVWVTNVVIGTPLAGALGSLASMAMVLARARLRERIPLRMPGRVRRDLAPYGVLIAGLLVTSGLGAVWPGGEPAGLVATRSPATWLLLTSILAPVLLGQDTGMQKTALRQACIGWWPIALATVLFLALGVLLASTGMSAALAQAGASLGSLYPALAPWVGALGGFLTSSNTGASAMFAASQAQIAQVIGYPVLTMVAFQNVAASLATMAAVPRVMMACQVARDTAMPEASPLAGDGTAIVLRSTVWSPLLVIVSLALLVLSGMAMLLH